jgi:hypothetical protein
MGLDMYLTRIPKTEVYWRKANAIHNYMVEHHDYDENCSRIELSRDDIEELRNRCTDVLSDRSLAPELLPTTDGFFFGDLEYNEWYFNTLERTEQELTALLSDNSWDFMIYQASW